MFFVIEGIDGAGCETQAKLVSDKLKKLGKTVHFFKYPHYTDPIGKMIKAYMYDNQKLLVNQQFLLYSLQFIFDSEKIQKAAQDGIAIADRYFTTTLCYQILEGFSENKALQFAQDFGIIQPDMVFFLDVKPDTAIAWKQGEGKILNFREKDLVFMKKTYGKYHDLMKRNVWTKWVNISGERRIKDVGEEIINKILISNN